MIILSIETSCDETAAAIVEFKRDKVKVLANIVSSQVKAHSKYGGVVPSLASRMHLKNMIPVLRRAFKEAEKEIDAMKKLSFQNCHSELVSESISDEDFSCFQFTKQSIKRIGEVGGYRKKILKQVQDDKQQVQDDNWRQDNRAQAIDGSFKMIFEKIDYISVTNGPGLIPALMVGVGAAKALAYSLDKPLVGVNHLEGHIYANWLMPIRLNPKSKIQNPKQIQNSKFKIQNSILWQPEFPILCLIVSGGHTQLVLMKKDLDYKIIGETMDDAAGEAFDKVAKLLGIGYPGGPLVEKLARKGDRNKFKFPRPMMNSGNYNFSFSGLKTAVLYETQSKHTPSASQPPLSRGEYTSGNNDIKYKSDIVASFQQAVIDVLVSKTIAAAKEYKVKNIILGGGVSANKELQRQFENAINKELLNTKYQILNTKLMTDNALMIAIAAYYNITNNKNIKSWKNVKADANLRL